MCPESTNQNPGREGRCPGCEYGMESIESFKNCPRCGTDWTIYPPAPSPVSVDRDGLLDDIATGIAGLWENAWMDPDCRPGPDDVALAVAELIRANIAPLIVKAERDRIREAIEDRRIVGAKQRINIAFNEGLDFVLALLDEEARND